MSRSGQMLAFGCLLGVVGGVLLSVTDLAYVLLAVAGVVGQIGVIGLGVRLGMADHASPPEVTADKPRPWQRDT